MMTYEEAKQIALGMPDVVAQGPQYLEEFVQGFMQAMNEDNVPSDLKGEA